MGAGDSKLSFKKGVFRLAEEHNIPANDDYWLSFWRLPESAEDVFTLFSAADIRRTRDQHLENLETLILIVTSRLFALRQHPSFPDAELAPEKDALNCIRILTRLLPFIYEVESFEAWESRFFWGSRRRRIRRPGDVHSEVIFDESDRDGTRDAEENRTTATEEFEDAPPLMEELIDTLVDLLFYSGFTLPQSSQGGSKVSYAIWQSGVGCNTSVGTTKEFESNKIETLRLLLAITSKSMFMPANVLPVKGTKALTYMVTSSDKKIVLTLLCSLLNTTLKYNPASWRVPYDHVVFSDPRQVLVTYCLQLLLVLLLYPVPQGLPAQSPLKNNYRHYLGRLHRTVDFQFLVDGMTRVLNQPVRILHPSSNDGNNSSVLSDIVHQIQATTSYLPGAQKTLKWAPEMMMLFWESLQCNKRFRSFIIDTDRVHDFVILIMYYALEHRLDPSKSGVVRMCIFVLQTLSTEPKFGMSLNKGFEGQNTLPATVRIPAFSGTYADYLIISIYSLITSSKGKLGAVYPALLAIIANVAPHIKNLSPTASSKLVQLFASISAPGFLLANESNHALLHSLLESINSIIEHQYAGLRVYGGDEENPNFIYALLRAHKRIEALRTFTLESGQEELDRQARLKKDASAPTSPAIDSPKISLSEELRPIPTPTALTPASPSAFEIGDDEDSEEEKEAPVSSPVGEEDAVPLQLRGMSEKARGKLPEGALLSRTGSGVGSLVGSPVNTVPPATVLGGFVASKDWVDSWLPHLPLHTLLTLLSSHLQTYLSASPTSSSPPPSSPTSASTTTIPATPSLLETLRTTPLSLDLSPVKIHMFEWSPPALGWYESLLWGFIFVAERHVAKGTVGVWNGTTVKLFRVQETAREGPSLLAPRGGVDAIGSSLVERLGGVAGRRTTG
ncbi:hypothetical protein RUND412_003408 [Rhizina undulata]